MIVTCTACRTRYSLDPASLVPRGRTVRCARCGHSWMQPPPDDMPKVVEPPPRPFSSAASPPPLAACAHTRLGLVLGLLAVIVIGAATGALFGRDRVIAAWPGAEAWYGKIGLAPHSPLDGLEIVARMERLEDQGVTVIVVSGEIVNTSDRAVAAPRLRGVLRDAAKQELDSWTFAPAGERLLPGATLPFSDRYENPPEDATEVIVLFDSAG
ncbi:MAG: DUF3426 domain-containing protein [Alphaproteobacteria bacterium]|nr:DUF3426 domain-containing protein [Alphaproteobacteria bacterium]